jgi:hypothetical protein
MQELNQREEIIAKKEAMLAEKNELEIKKLRSSQASNKVCKILLLLIDGLCVPFCFVYFSLQNIITLRIEFMQLVNKQGVNHCKTLA